MNSILFFKLITVPMLLWLMYAVSQHLGRRTGSILAGLPLVMGPISVFITIEQGTAFGAQTALNVLPGICGYAFFCLAIAWSSKRFSIFPAFTIASIAYFVSGLIFSLVAHSIVCIALVTFFLPYLVIRLLPTVPQEAKPNKAGKTKPPLMQMLIGAVLVIVETGVAPYLGPVLSGIVIFFPVLGGVAVVFAGKESGADAVTHVVAGALMGLAGSTAFALTTAFVLESLGGATAYTAAIAMTLLASLTSHWLQTRFVGETRNPKETS